MDKEAVALFSVAEQSFEDTTTRFKFEFGLDQNFVYLKIWNEARSRAVTLKFERDGYFLEATMDLTFEEPNPT